MIECSNYEEWFHLKCDHSVSKKNAELFMVVYIIACNCMIHFGCILLMLELELIV